MNEAKNKEMSPEEGKKEELTELGTVKLDGGARIRCITIIGQVEGHYALEERTKTTKYEHILPLIIDAEESAQTDGLLVILNTVGGDVEAGLAIAELLSSISKPTVSIVIGGGHSIGVPIAVACTRSFIVPSATMTLHPVRITGTVLGVSQAFDYLSRMQKRVCDFIVSHSNIGEETLYALLHNTEDMTNDIGTVLDGKKAVECGLIDELGGLYPAVSTLKALIKEKKGGEKK